jgi:hypothetical protein
MIIPFFKTINKSESVLATTQTEYVSKILNAYLNSNYLIYICIWEYLN